jgi:hypothetical protein
MCHISKCFLSAVSYEYRKSDRQLMFYIEIHTDYLQHLHLYMCLASRAYWIQFCINLIAEIFHNNYYSQFYLPFLKLVQ